jgi:shikimate kinase
MKRKKIFFVGFMGSGKSTIANLLASEMKLPLKDTDFIIEERAKLTISEIFKEHGEDFFRYLEGVVLNEILLEAGVMIVSTGGGLPCFDHRMEWMNRNDITIYLKCSVETIYNRIQKDCDKRPLLVNRTENELKEFVQNKLDERKSIYESATITVDGNLSSNEVVKEILNQIKLQAE